MSVCMLEAGQAGIRWSLLSGGLWLLDVWAYQIQNHLVSQCSGAAVYALLAVRCTTRAIRETKS